MNLTDEEKAILLTQLRNQLKCLAESFEDLGYSFEVTDVVGELLDLVEFDIGELGYD